MNPPFPPAPVLLKCADKAQLIKEYCLAHNLTTDGVHPLALRYRPHQYRGGWVIPGFGFETSRIISNYVPETAAGDPVLACSWENHRDPRAYHKAAGW